MRFTIAIEPLRKPIFVAADHIPKGEMSGIVKRLAKLKLFTIPLKKALGA